MESSECCLESLQTQVGVELERVKESLEAAVTAGANAERLRQLKDKVLSSLLDSNSDFFVVVVNRWRRRS